MKTSKTTQADNSEMPPHLKKVDADNFNISRKKWGRGFRYLNEDGESLVDDSILDTVQGIAVPNTWTDVTLSDRSDTYIQARGYDGAGKLQYLYHPDYLAYRNEQKFNELLDFGRVIPRIRRRLRKDLAAEHWDEQKLLALIVKILDKYHLRIGSRIYAQKGQSYGLTTLRKKHLKEEEDSFSFEYIGKSGQERTINLTDSSLVKLIEEVAEFPGWELFSFRTDEGKYSANAGEVNNYIRKISGGDFSARDFRTWAGTVLSLKYLSKAQTIVEKNPKRKLGSTLVELVSEKLGNTPAICKDYYIHPEVLKHAIKEDFDSEPCEEKFLKNSLYRKHECRTMEILEKMNKES
ncbi:topoisomerase IB [Owenweeksia hongkongensis DSM 17368]|uniref:Topoisomerase IB n=1 Tax=Owenweeksia hongkongensis (strain DSM 17368 / CIP 108786 / JCM 12287 / NRRL B-23963 / UST20020801) TaxID=926562 RepID=G8QZU6_OWEHD|nr:DNA topoisomerase IB [Owenweeksia hongkongensis]AEV31540.1 topoisomerase IB [Owenweeksia hongkongensis DSM 17368]